METDSGQYIPIIQESIYHVPPEAKNKMFMSMRPCTGCGRKLFTDGWGRYECGCGYKDKRALKSRKK